MIKGNGASVVAPNSKNLSQNADRAATGNTKYRRSGKNFPCPVCGRTKDKDCSLHPDGQTAHCKTYVSGIGHDPSQWHYNGVNKQGFQGIFVLKQAEPNFIKPIRLKNERFYYYPNRDGSPLVRVKRIDKGNGEKKDFFQSHWDGSNWSDGNPDNIRRQIHIYRCAEVQAAIQRQELIFVVEGEVTVDALWKLGIAATTTIGGSGSYANYGVAYREDLVGARLVLTPDRDSAGVEYMSNFDRDFNSQIEGWYLAGTQGLWRNPQGGMDIGDEIDDFQLTKEQILAKVITTTDYQQISKSFKTGSTSGVDRADNLSATYQQLSADEVKALVEAIVQRNLPPADRESELVVLARQLSISKQSLAGIADRLEGIGSASADKVEIEKILTAQRHQLSPHRILPTHLAGKIEQISFARGTNPEPMILGLLVATSSVAHANTRLIVGNYGDELSIYPNLFGMGVGDSGSLKSPTINTSFTKPLRSLQTTYIERYETELQQYKAELQVWESSDKKQRGDEPIKPQLTVVIAEDATMEKIEDLALHQPTICPGIYRDEIIGIFQAFDKHGGKGGNDSRAKLLSYYDGSPINIHRVGTGSKISKHDYHPVVFGGIQPEVLKGLAQSIGMDNDGTLCRFLYAPIYRHYKDWDEHPDTPKIDITAFNRLIEGVHNLPPLECHLDDRGQKVWANVANHYNHECLNNPKLSQWLKHSYSKAIGQLGKLALTLHLIECATTGTLSAVISGETIERAALALDYFISQAIALIASTEDTLEAHLVRVLEKAKKLGSIAPRQVQTLFSGKKRIDGATARSYLQQLVDGGYGFLRDKGIFTPEQLKTSPRASADNANNADKVLISYQQPEPSLDNSLSHSADNADNLERSIYSQPQHNKIELDIQVSHNASQLSQPWQEIDEWGTCNPEQPETAPKASADNADKLLISYQQPEPSLANGLSHSADNADNLERSIYSQPQHNETELDIQVSHNVSQLSQPWQEIDEWGTCNPEQPETASKASADNADKVLTIDRPLDSSDLLSENDRPIQKGDLVIYVGTARKYKQMTGRVIAVVDNTCETTFTVKHREVIAIADLKRRANC